MAKLMVGYDPEMDQFNLVKVAGNKRSTVGSGPSDIELAIQAMSLACDRDELCLPLDMLENAELTIKLRSGQF